MIDSYPVLTSLLTLLTFCPKTTHCMDGQITFKPYVFVYIKYYKPLLLLVDMVEVFSIFGVLTEDVNMAVEAKENHHNRI